MRNREIRLTPEDAVNGLSHYLCLSFDSRSAQIVFNKDVKPHWIILEVTFKFFNGHHHINKPYRYVFIHK